jgi:large subunit ribosomal protein L35
MGKKQKTHKGLKGRVKITKSGKIMHRRAGKRHLMSGKSGKKSRVLGKWKQLPDGERRLLKRQFNFA